MTRLVLGLSGFAGVGKDALADHLVAAHGFTRRALADPIKEAARVIFGFSHEQLWGPSSARNAYDARAGCSPRHACQTIGTEWGRTCIDDRVWLRCFARWLEEHPEGDVVVPDVRFRNEVEILRAAGAAVVRIVRPGRGPLNDHASEMEMLGLPDSAFDGVLSNDQGVADLRARGVELVARLRSQQ